MRRMPMQFAQPSPPAHDATRERSRRIAIDACEYAFTPHRMTRQYPSWLDVPRAGELHLWRFRSGWLPVATQEGERWLSETERERARLNPNAALRKRFVASRVVLRWIVANLFDASPQDMQFIDGHAERPGVQFASDGHPVSIDIAYGGIWVVIGVASTALGLGVTMPTLGTEIASCERARATIWPTGAPDRFDKPSRYVDESLLSARYSSLSNALKQPSINVAPHTLRDDAIASFVDLSAAGRWHVVDLPMPGKIRAAVSVAQPISKIQAFGWQKSQGASG